MRLWERVRVTPGAALWLAGLDYNYMRHPFGQVLPLATCVMAASHAPFMIERCVARCCHVHPDTGAACTAPAVFTQRLAAGGTAEIAVGGEDLYRPACAAHHLPTPCTEDEWPVAAVKAAREAAVNCSYPYTSHEVGAFPTPAVSTRALE